MVCDFVDDDFTVLTKQVPVNPRIAQPPNETNHCHHRDPLGPQRQPTPTSSPQLVAATADPGGAPRPFHADRNADAVTIMTRIERVESEGEVPEAGSQRQALSTRHGAAIAIAAPHAAIGISAAATFAWVYQSGRTSMLSECIVHKATGVYCPACGGLRAMHDLMHGHVLDALRDNVLVTIGVPLVLTLWLLALFRKGRSTEHAAKASGVQIWLAALAVMTVFTVVRNLASFSFLVPV